MTARARILVLRGGAIGDFILTLPALQTLRDLWPDAHVELIGYPHIARLGLLGGTVNAVDSLDRAGMAKLYALRGDIDDALRARIKSFDLVLSYLHDPEGSVRDHLEATGVAQVLGVSPVQPPEHAADHLARPLESLALYAEGRPPVVAPDPEACAAARRLLKAKGCSVSRTVFLHPGSGSAKKNWPLPRFLELARRLRMRKFHPVFTFGEADGAAWAAYVAAAVTDVHMDTPDLCVLAALLASARAYVGNDSGITHLAAAAGTAVVALFGPTDPAIWGPRGKQVDLLRADGGRMESLSVETVEAALLDALSR